MRFRTAWDIERRMGVMEYHIVIFYQQLTNQSKKIPILPSPCFIPANTYLPYVLFLLHFIFICSHILFLLHLENAPALISWRDLYPNCSRKGSSPHVTVELCHRCVFYRFHLTTASANSSPSVFSFTFPFPLCSLILHNVAL